MPHTYTNPIYDYVRSPDQDASMRVHHPVVIVGAGPSGLAASLDLARQGIKSVVLDDNNTVSVGSRAICFAKRTLEICDRLGCGDRMVDKGVTWKLGKVFFKEKQVYEFNLLPEEGHKLPAFINLQQYYFEEYLVDRIAEVNDVDLRWKSKVSNVETDDTGTRFDVETPDGSYQMSCDYLLVADGAGSPIRTALGLESKGQIFNDQFLIADIEMTAKFPTERWFWFDPPFHPNQSVLLHKQPDNVWRIDFQLGADADPNEEKKPENIEPRIKAMLGEDVEWNMDWASVYTFRCRRMDSFIHHRVIFMGDAAHQVSPFGARGANGALQSTDNLCWKLARILRNEAPQALLDTYNDERIWGASENILNSTRATDFITPKNHISRVFRDEVLRLAKNHPFARALVNSGRLSAPSSYLESPLNTADVDDFPASNCPGSVCKDAPIILNGDSAWLMNQLGDQFTVIVNAEDASDDLVGQLQSLADTSDLKLLYVAGTQPAAAPQADCIQDSKGYIAERFDLTPGAAYLIRPDQHVAGRWKQLQADTVKTAMRRALGFELS